jgi:signal transduction histidine kinase
MNMILTKWFKDAVRSQEHGSSRQATRLRRQYIKSLPKWRRPLVGYICAIPILLVTLFLTISLQQLLHRFLFPGTFLLLPLLLVALLWGAGPALLLLVISIISLNYYFGLIVGQFSLADGRDIFQVLPLFVIGLIILLVTSQRERAYINAQSYASELETKNSQLDEANREKDGLLSIASHELKTPVMAIRGESQLLLRRLAKRPDSIDIKEVEYAFKRINEQTTRMTALIDDLLDVNNLRSTRTVLNKTRYDLNQLCHKVIEDQRLLTGREVVFSPTIEPLELYIDVDRITQAVINLVSNAMKYSPEDKPVEVCVNRNSQSALLQVKDHGRGIAPNELPHIFEIYYRAPGARSSTTSGLGLGLTICKDIIDRHEGRIWCESELNVGTTFFVELPLRALR